MLIYLPLNSMHIYSSVSWVPQHQGATFCHSPLFPQAPALSGALIQSQVRITPGALKQPMATRDSILKGYEKVLELYYGNWLHNSGTL